MRSALCSEGVRSRFGNPLSVDAEITDAFEQCGRLDEEDQRSLESDVVRGCVGVLGNRAPGVHDRYGRSARGGVEGIVPDMRQKRDAVRGKVCDSLFGTLEIRLATNTSGEPMLRTNPTHSLASEGTRVGRQRVRALELGRAGRAGGLFRKRMVWRCVPLWGCGVQHGAIVV